MHKEFLMGNAAIALGAVAAGVNVVAGYPGTPSTEDLETVAKYRPDDVYVEWSVNEIAAMEHCTASSVGQSINRAKEKIKAQMKKYLCA